MKSAFLCWKKVSRKCELCNWIYCSRNEVYNVIMVNHKGSIARHRWRLSHMVFQSVPEDLRIIHFWEEKASDHQLSRMYPEMFFLLCRLKQVWLIKAYLRETLYGIHCVGRAKDHSIQSSLALNLWLSYKESKPYVYICDSKLCKPLPVRSFISQNQNLKMAV